VISSRQVLQTLFLTIEEDTSDDFTASRYSVLSRFPVIGDFGGLLELDVRDNLRLRGLSDVIGVKSSHGSSIKMDVSSCDVLSLTTIDVMKSFTEKIAKYDSRDDMSKVVCFKTGMIETIFATVGISVNTTSIDGKSFRLMEKLWVKAVETIEDLSQRVEHDAITKHLSSLRLSKLGFAVTEKFHQYNENEEKLCNEWVLSSGRHWDASIDSFLANVKDYVRKDQVLVRSINRIKTGLFHELQNERGTDDMFHTWMLICDRW